MGINRVVVSGNLTRNPELRQTANGMAVLSFGIAVNDRRKNVQTGEWEDYPNFLDCTIFGARAESLSRYLTKGSKVAIEGKLRWSQWERDGQKRSKVEIIVDSLDFMSTRNGAGGGYSPEPQAAPVAPAASSATETFGGGQVVNTGASIDAMPSVNTESGAYDEDIPF